MKNKKITIITILVLFILVAGLFFSFNKKFNIENIPRNSKSLVVKNYDRISFESGILNQSEVSSCDGDFQVTFYQIEGIPEIATISTIWKEGHPRYSAFCPKTALTKKISEKSFDDITIQDCKILNYERHGTALNEGEVVCLKSEDGNYFIIKLTQYYGDYRGEIEYKFLS